MSTLKTYNLTLDISTGNYATGDSVAINILDVNAYKVILTVEDNGTAVNLSTSTPTISLDGNNIVLSITDAPAGELEIDLYDLSSFTANIVLRYLLKLTGGGIERNYKGFTANTYTLP